jgi:hypothetical protein
VGEDLWLVEIGHNKLSLNLNKLKAILYTSNSGLNTLFISINLKMRSSWSKNVLGIIVIVSSPRWPNCKDSTDKHIAIVAFTKLIYFRTKVSEVTLMLNYGDNWRLHRRVFHQEFNKDAVSTREKLDVQVKHTQYVSIRNIEMCLIS